MKSVYELGPFRLDPEAGVLTHAGSPLALGARGVAVLTALVKAPNEFVRKASILDAAWPGVVVEENSLAAQISAIRRALAKAPGGERWIETLARRGYRFVGPVIEIRDSAPQGATGVRQRSNLPEPMTSFIGRERELVEIKRLLPSTRLLTLVGVGGIGKTRLALQAAAEVLEAYRDGVWLVDLALLADPALVPSAVGQALGASEAMGKPILETVCAQLKGQQALLLLDNCEHLLEACARAAETLLRGAAELTILATSREPLCIAGEQTYSLPTLSLPDPAADAQSAGRSEAVQLFVERARKQQPDFVLTATRVPVVAQICIRLDGIPLALELAAARIRSLSVEQINARLDDRFRLLTDGTRTALPRHQTLRATLDWSYDLLAEPERVVLRRLAVFAGGFTLEAAAFAASDESIDEFAVIDILSQLVARSLVVADTSSAGARYRLLETTRAYALEQLAEADGIDAMRRRHAEYFRGLFEDASDDWLRMSDAQWRAIYPPELDNVRWTLDWALRAGGDAALGIALAGASRPVWSTLGLFEEGKRWLEAAVARVEPQTPVSDQARLWFALGVLSESSAPVRSVENFERAIGLYRTLGDSLRLGHALVEVAWPLVALGRLEQCSLALEEAFPMLEDSGLPKLCGVFFTQSGFLKTMSGDLAGARMDYEKALSLYRKSGAESAVSGSLARLAELTWALGDLDAAAAAFAGVVAAMREPAVNRKTTLGYALANLAGVLTERGELDEALAAEREGLSLLLDGGFAWIFADHAALRAALAGNLAYAARLAGFADAVHSARKASREPNEERARTRLHALLREKLAPDKLECLLAEGAKMSEDEACRLALEDCVS